LSAISGEIEPKLGKVDGAIRIFDMAIVEIDNEITIEARSAVSATLFLVGNRVWSGSSFVF
jgi:hypothetical protein